MVVVYPLFLPLERSNSTFFRQNPFKLSEVSDSSKIACEPTPLGQENSHSRDFVEKHDFLVLSGKPEFDTNVNF